MCHKTLLTATIGGKSSRGREQQIVSDTMVNDINIIMHNVGKDGRVDEWINNVKCASN